MLLLFILRLLMLVLFLFLFLLVVVVVVVVVVDGHVNNGGVLHPILYVGIERLCQPPSVNKIVQVEISGYYKMRLL